MSANALQTAALTDGCASTVSPVVDYEPPAFGGPPALPPAAARRSRPAPRPQPPTAPKDDGRARAAAAFADAALRRVLEVIDRRRPLAQLRPLLAAPLVDSLLAAGHREPDQAAQLRRVRAQVTRADGTAAEAAAWYTRGQRAYAIACRIEAVMTPTGPRWQVVALHLG